MGSKTPSTSTDDDERNAATATVVDQRSRKGKVPKRINKAVRERLKREHLNELFIDLADNLDCEKPFAFSVSELNQHNSGKASILCEATRFLKDVFGQIESLRKDHASLLSESNYVTTEKNELKEETSLLETEIQKLRNEIEARVSQSKPDLNTLPAPEYHHYHQQLASPFSGLPISQQPATLLVLPMQSNLQTQDVSDMTQVYNSSNVSKPCPRYASAADSWPSRLLGEQLRASD
ncbi:unnamed protein product [Arabis nemorensis]|uniref:BHLH domain-containing protein n=1 Tax=Arabis nemorensis TaxID=586526 RepID=A0A565BT67_9BRAS|nr:unnamed protein product [Arabis nemorensis]